MKATCVFLLLSLALCWYQGFAEANGAAVRGTKPACGKFNLSKGCSKIFEPVCGTNDVTYGNECLLCLENLQRRTNVRIQNRGICQKAFPSSG